MNPLRRFPVSRVGAGTLVSLVAILLVGFSQQLGAQAADIPEPEVTSLLRELAGQKTHSSAVKQRRACKTVTRGMSANLDTNKKK